MDATHKRLAANIRATATAKKIPLSHVPDLAGISRASFWAVLNGSSSPRLKLIVQLAKALGLKPADLIS